MIVLAIPDLHAPWIHPEAIEFLAECKRIYKPDMVVCLGDEIDAHRWTDHPQDPDAPGPADEMEYAWRTLIPIYKLFKTVYVCNSNHTRRIYRKAAQAQIPVGFLKSVGEIIGAPDTWRWSDWWDIDGVHYRHGDGYSGAQAALRCAERMRRSTVIGHIHAFAGIQYSQGVYDRIWGMNAGALLDPDAAVFQYGKYLASRAVIGCGIIRNGVPSFVPLDSVI